MKSPNITQKLIISLILISLLPYAAVTYYNYSSEKTALEKSVFDDLSALVEAKNTHINTVVNFRIEQVQEVATSNFMQQIETGKTGDINLNLLRVQKQIPEFLEISALDRNGTVVASTEARQINKNYAGEDFFKNGTKGLYLGNINYYDNRTAYIVSYNVLNRSTGKPIGVIAAWIMPVFIYDVTSDYTGLGETGESLLVQKRGNEVVYLNPLRHNTSAAFFLKYPLDSNIAIPAILAASGGNGTIRALDYRGTEVFAAYTYIPIGDWGLVVKIDSTEALIPADRFKERSLALGIFYFAVVAVMAYFLGRRLTAPLIRLTDASRKVTKGYLTVHIEPKSRDEIGELAQSFNAMVQRLKEVYEGLEQKVKERTGDLDKRNLELAALIKTNQSISSGLDLKKVLDIVVREAVRIVNVSYCSIILIEKDAMYGMVASEYSPKQIKPSLGEILVLKECPMLDEAYQDRKYVFVPDIAGSTLSPNERGMAERLDMRSLLVVPLVIGEKTLGTMQLGSLSEAKEFTGEEIGICQAIANQAAIAIENANLYEELKYHDETLETLYEIDRVVSQSLELDELLRESITKTIQVTSADAGWIYLLQEDGETLNLQTYIGISPELAEAASKLKVGQGVSGMAVESGKPVTMDIENYPYPRLLTLMEKDDIKSLVGIPLVAKGKVGGAMVLSNRKHRIFKKEDIDLLSSIGSQVGVAVENARLYSELKRHDETLETLFEIDRVVSQSLDLDEIFREALAKTIQATSSDAGAIYTLEEEAKTLKLKTSSGLSMDFAGAVSEIKVGGGVAGGAVQAKKPIVTDIDHYPGSELLPFLKKEGLVALVGVPLMAKGRVVGALNLGNRSRRTFSKEDLEVLASIGGQIGVAIENARLYQEAKTSYEKLEAAYEELKSLDRMKSEFLSNVSHELKTPLVSIRGYSELLYDEKLGLIKDEQRKSLQAIIRNADRLTRLINSILFISKMQAEKLEFQFQPVDMDEIVKVCVDDARSMIDTKQITFEKDIPKISKVNGEKDRFTEVISNLLDNAIKFTPTGGKISIKALDEGEFVHFVVTDNGIGIPLEIIPKLFSRFYQADASASRKYGGTGLGLYITKNIVDAFRGKIWIESEVGKGTKVHVLLPIAR
ncbi:MAG: GAF domain-containing protein [Candidatus Methanoperedens sp.]|nr:GAF domain-containing protein [Candidatus Methanoperedens sp.]